jgi:hypothetical protein
LKSDKGDQQMTYEALKAEVLHLREEGKIRTSLSPAERADWAFGTTVIENRAVTLAMATAAVEAKARRQ